MKYKSERFESGYQAFMRACRKLNISTLCYFFGFKKGGQGERTLIQRFRETDENRNI